MSNIDYVLYSTGYSRSESPVSRSAVKPLSGSPFLAKLFTAAGLVRVAGGAGEPVVLSTYLSTRALGLRRDNSRVIACRYMMPQPPQSE